MNQGKAPCLSVWSLRRVDFCFLNPNFPLPIAQAFVHFNAASDHLPMVVDIQVAPELQKQ